MAAVDASEDVVGTPLRNLLVLSLAVVAVVAGLPAASGAGAAGRTTIRVLSNRADLVSGGDALVEVVPPEGVDPGGVRVSVDGRDVTDAFAVRGDGRFYGLVTGLRVGRNVLTARLRDGSGARLAVTNHPSSGPVFSGPHIAPWTCAAGAEDADCTRAATYTFQYKSTGGQFLPYDEASPPRDVATTTTEEGVEVPYIVRVETGVVARDEYRIAVLFDPSKPWEPGQAPEGFSGKVLVTHGASCNTEYQQAAAPDVMNDTALSRGFAVMSHALNNAGHNCNVITQAESMVMTKERLIEQYGPVRYTMGIGGSGGALAQNLVANAYPGFYQGIITAAAFPDSWSGRMLYEDYSLLRRYFENPTRWQPGVAWTPVDIANLWGHPNYVNSITYNTAISPILDPSRSCVGVATADVYDAATNPDGVRCSLQDYMVNVFGRRPQDGFARRPWDNTGVQYGLQALLAGDLTTDQFVDVNAKVGGRDIDYEPQAARAEADPPALGTAFRSGAVNTASNLDQVAIIDLRGPDPGAFHDVYRTYALRARLEREHGHANNMALWRGPVPLAGDASFMTDAIIAMDEWLSAIEHDSSRRPLPEKIVLNRPASAADRCVEGAGMGGSPGQGFCNTAVDSYSTARIQAGMPFTDDVIKCQLKPLRQSDYYPVRFTDAQWQTLQQTFPQGVCDYSKPAVDMQPTVGWLTYAGGPGGRPLGPPPASTPLRSGGPWRSRGWGSR